MPPQHCNCSDLHQNCNQEEVTILLLEKRQQMLQLQKLPPQRKDKRWQNNLGLLLKRSQLRFGAPA